MMIPLTMLLSFLSGFVMETRPEWLPYSNTSTFTCRLHNDMYLRVLSVYSRVFTLHAGLIDRCHGHPNKEINANYRT